MAYRIDPTDQRPVYLQISDQIIDRIHTGVYRPHNRLVSTRILAERLQVNRKTIVAAYEDAVDQGYLVSKRGSGYTVVKTLPLRKPLIGDWLVDEDNTPAVLRPSIEANFAFTGVAATYRPAPPDALRITEGSPDVRLSDLEEIYVEARRLLRRSTGRHLIRYGNGQGDQKLRETLVAYLGASRGITTSAKNVLITRGSQHGFQLAARLLFQRGGVLAAAGYSYDPVLMIAEDYGAEIIRIPLDEHGLDVDALANHPRLSEIRAVYVTPHHQYPTTVTLPPARRIQLLELAREYRFAILEDDYDYDFHYDKAPNLPLAALDRSGSVLYLGSFTKIIAPGLRIGYLIGPEDFIAAALRQRLLTDRQGNMLLERALANYIQAGNLDRHLRRVRKQYHRRRDHFVQLLQNELGDRVTFTVPSGGMAIWARFPYGINHEKLSTTPGIWLNQSHRWWRESNCLRLGFASLNKEEIVVCVAALKEAVKT